MGRTLLRIGLASIGIGLAAWIVLSMDAAAVWEAARGADTKWLALSLVPLIARFVIWAIKWAGMLPTTVRMRAGTALRVVLAGAFVNTVTPTAKLAGGFYRAAHLMRMTEWRYSTAYGWALADQIQNTVGSLMLFGVMALVAAAELPGGPMRVTLLVTGAGGIAVSVAALGLRRWLWTRLRTSRGADSGRLAWLKEALRPFLAERLSAAETTRDIGLAVLSFGCLCLSNALVFRALDVGAPVIQVAVFLMVGAFAGNLAGMGGLGVTEATLTTLYSRIGVGPASAVAAALLHRAWLYAIVLFAGGAMLTADILGDPPSRRGRNNR